MFKINKNEPKNGYTNTKKKWITNLSSFKALFFYAYRWKCWRVVGVEGGINKMLWVNKIVFFFKSIKIDEIFSTTLKITW